MHVRHTSLARSGNQHHRGNKSGGQVSRMTYIRGLRVREFFRGALLPNKSKPWKLFTSHFTAAKLRS